MNKEIVHRAILNNLNERIESLNSILKETFEATAEDSKSSAGDKHETGVATQGRHESRPRKSAAT